MADKRYSLARILDVDSRFKVLFGERSNGKSYAVKREILKDVWSDLKHKKFVYLRRWREDIVNKGTEDYFEDMEEDDEGNRRVEEITDGAYDCIAEWRGEIYLAKRDEMGKKVRGVQVGKTVVMTGDTHHKSRAYVGYFNIVFEEFITDKGYLYNEVKTFMSIVSTILRRRDGRVFMIGNTITTESPYFKEWELVNVPKQKQGTIDLYVHRTSDADENGNPIEVRIACEYCENSEGVSKMIIANKMINTGEWYTEEKEHLPMVYSEYRRHMSVLIDGGLTIFAIDLLSYDKCCLLYVREDDRRWVDYDRYDIVLTDRYYHEHKFVKRLGAYPKICALYKRLFDIGKICYSDNLTGTTFAAMLNNRQIF